MCVVSVSVSVWVSVSLSLSVCVCVCVCRDRQTDRQAGIQIDRQTDRQTDRQSERQTERQPACALYTCDAQVVAWGNGPCALPSESVVSLRAGSREDHATQVSHRNRDSFFDTPVSGRGRAEMVKRRDFISGMVGFDPWRLLFVGCGVL